VRAALIVNPGSGGGTDPAALAAGLRERGVELTGVFAPQQAEQSGESGPERIVVAGGDGSVALAAAAAARLGVPLAVLAVGTANDFARARGLPRELEAALDLAADPRAATRHAELGRLASGCPFVNTASAGLASIAARHAVALKRRLGPLAYGVGAARAALQEQPIACAVRADGQPVFAGEAWQVIVGVTGAFGGGSSLGMADHDDGRLDVAVLPAGPRAALPRRGLGLRMGTITDQPDVAWARGAVIDLDLPPYTELNVDGEVIQAAEPERATVQARAFELVVPAS
jgi:diacylglycerol kinase family enzyme